MAKAPTVQTLDQIMASLQPGYAAQQGIINKQIANTGETYKASKLALDAAKTQGFNQINDQATGKGLAFSGVPISEQSNYLSTQYLPGVQKAQAQQKADTLTLEGQLASLNTEQRNKALDTRTQQQSALNAWNLQERQLAAQAKQAALDRQLQASEGAANRAASASSAAADRTYAASQAASTAAALKSLTNTTAAYLESKKGHDNHVSPSTWQKARQSWVANGGSVDSFNATFSGYVNSSYKTYTADYGLF